MVDSLVQAWARVSDGNRTGYSTPPMSAIDVRLVDLLSCLLLLTALSLSVSSLEESLLPLAFTCGSQEQQLHVLMPARSSSSRAGTISSAGIRACLKVYNNYDSNWQSIVLTNSTEMRTVSSKDQRLLHTTLKIPPDYVECQYFYRWKIEELNTSQSTNGNCAAATPEQECEVSVGRRKGCSGWRPSHSNGLNCRPDLVDPGSYNALRLQLCRHGRVQIAAGSTAAWLGPLAASVGCILVAMGAVLALYRMIPKLTREGRNQLTTNSRTTCAQAVPTISIFSLLPNASLLRQAMQRRHCNSLPNEQHRFDYLMTHPDTAERCFLMKV